MTPIECDCPEPPHTCGTVADLRRRIQNAPPPITTELLTALRGLPHVAAVRDEWFHGSVRIAVYLTEWDEDTWHGAHDLIDAFARPHVREFGVDGEVITPTRRSR